MRPIHKHSLASTVPISTGSLRGSNEGISGYTFVPRSSRDGSNDNNINCDKESSDNVITILL